MKLRLQGLFTLLLLFSIQLVIAQDKPISGKIVDAQGVPLVGVTIVVEGTNRGVVSDFDGNYTISARTGNTLRFSYIGLKSQLIPVGSSTTIDVVMVEDLESLDTVVITGYQNIKKELFTGASQTIQATEIKMDGVPDISQALEGRAAGVAVQNVTGTFGAAPRITIRGSSSILGDTKPLWIVDGVIQEAIVDISFSDLVSGNPNTILSSAISGLNPSDVKSFEILKDASATALYGARALNGVIVITTKSGVKNQKPQFNYTSEYLVRDRPRYSQFNLLNSQETISVYEEMFNKGFLRYPNVLFGRSGGVYNLRATAINTYDETNGSFGIPNTQEARAAFLQQYELANTDWFKVLFRMTPTQTHNISFSSGGEKSTTYASLGYYTDAGWTVADRVRRITSNVRNTFDLANDKMKITTFLQANVRDQNAPGAQSLENDPFFGSFNREFDINPFSYALGTSRALRPRDNNGNLEYYRQNWAPFNILNETKNNTLNQQVIDTKFQLKLDYALTKNLEYTFLGSARYANSSGEIASRENSNVVGAYRAAENSIVQNANIFLFTDPDEPNAIPRVVLPNGGILTSTENTLTTYTLRNSLSFDKTFNDLHTLNIYANQEFRHIDRSRSSFTGYGYQFDRGGSIFTDPDILRKVILEGNDYFLSQQTRSRELSLAMTASYDYDAKYIFNVTGNYEGSNRAGQSSSARYVPTYSVGGRWNAHKESFLEDSDIISSLVIRPSYGVIGLIPSNASNNLAIFRNQITDRLDPDNRENFININDLENSDLTYELTKEVNLGFELGMFNERIRLILDLYERKGIDLIDLVRTSGIGGQDIKLGNNSEMTTKGLEFQLNTVNFDSEDFKWRTGFNISYIDQEITSILQRPRAFDLVNGQGLGNAVGFAPNALFSYQFTGLDEFGVPSFDIGEGNNSANGVDFQDTDSPLNYLVYEGPSLPTVSGGLANNFTYRNFDLSFFISFAAGNKIRLEPSYSSTYTDLDVFPTEFKNRWLLPGDELRTDIPVIPSAQLIQSYGQTNIQQIYNAYNYSTARIADGDFIRMKNVSFGYSFDKKNLNKLGLSSLRLNLQGTNLFLLYSDSKLGGQDPEFINTGGVATPITRQFTLSLNVGF